MWKKDSLDREAEAAPSFVPTAAATIAMLRSTSISSSGAATVAAMPSGAAAPMRPAPPLRPVAATSSTGPAMAMSTPSAVQGMAMRTVSPGPAMGARLTQVASGPILAAQGTPRMATRSVTPPRSMTPTGQLVRVVSTTGLPATGQPPLQMPAAMPGGAPVAVEAGSSARGRLRIVATAGTAPAQSFAGAVALPKAAAAAAAELSAMATPASLATPASSFGAASITVPVEGPRIERSVTPRRDALVAALPALSEAVPLNAEASQRRPEALIASQAVSGTHAAGIFIPAPPLPPPQANLAAAQTKPAETAVVQAPPPASEPVVAGQSLPPPRPPTQVEEARFLALEAVRHKGVTPDPRFWVNSSTTQLLPQREVMPLPDALSPYAAMAAVPGAGLLRPAELVATAAGNSMQPQRPPSPGLVHPMAPALSPPPTVGLLPGLPSPPLSAPGSPLGSHRGSPGGSPSGSPRPWTSAPPLQVPQGLYSPSPPPTAPASPSMPRLAGPSPQQLRSHSPPPSRPALPSSVASAAAAAAAVVASSPTEGLSREVAAHEVELHVLRSEVAAREAEAEHLRIQLKDTDAKLIDASGDVDTMSVKVETLAGNRHAVLKASAQHLEDQVEVLQKRLLLSEAELMEKDKEIRTLVEVVGDNKQVVARQQHALDNLHMSHMENGEKARWLAEHEGGLKRKQALDVWQENVRANLYKESADIALQREQRVVAEQCEQLSSDTAATRQFLLNLEQQCRRHAMAMEAEKKKMEELLMEDRLSESTAKIGQQAAHTQVQSQLAEMEGLEVRLQREVARKSARLAGAQAYAQHEVKAMRHMEELMSLTECLREITNVLRDSEQGSLSKDPIQRAVDEEVKLLRHIGGPVPPMVRISGDEYLIGGELMHCAEVDGRLQVRPQGANGGFQTMEDFVRCCGGGGEPPGSMPAAYGRPTSQRGVSPGPGYGGRARSASPAPPMVLGRESSRSLSRRPSRSPARGPPQPPVLLPPSAVPGSGMPPSMAGMRSWGMPALVAPVSIGGADPFMAPM